MYSCEVNLNNAFHLIFIPPGATIQFNLIKRLRMYLLFLCLSVLYVNAIVAAVVKHSVERFGSSEADMGLAFCYYIRPLSDAVV